MQSIKTYKERALADLENRWFDAAIVALVFYLIYEGIQWLVPNFLGQTQGLVFQAVWMLLCAPLSWSFTVLFLDFIRGEKLEISSLFKGYSDALRLAAVYFLYFLGICIGLVFFIVPGIIIALMYSQIPYILKDDSQVGIVEVFSKSAKMMQGHKMDLFWLGLSFIGWAILALLTLGIGFIFLSPYLNTTLAHYYEDLKSESNG